MNALMQNHNGGGDDWPDVFGQPVDELEALALQDMQKRMRLGDPVRVLEVDCGQGALALRLAKKGALVLAVDNGHDGARLKDAAKALEIGEGLRFLRVAMTGCVDTPPLPGAPFDLVVCRSTLSFLHHSEATVLVRRLLLMTRTGGRLYFSTYGVHSELAEDYPDAEQTVRDRFAPLAPEIAAKYGIDRPVCLYSERDLFLLLFNAGASVLRTFTTTHGNVKAIAGRV
jgi:2-polyprenyl-3-methyl-5-hydroxy-6-metoxy-1,4-benzoquinol methylase